MNMSASPPKDLEAEVGEQEQSPDEQEHMERGQQEASQQQPVFDFEVKEQDRWLPIANGKAFFPSLMPTLAFPSFFSSRYFSGALSGPGCSTVSTFYYLFFLQFVLTVGRCTWRISIGPSALMPGGAAASISHLCPPPASPGFARGIPTNCSASSVVADTDEAKRRWGAILARAFSPRVILTGAVSRCRMLILATFLQLHGL